MHNNLLELTKITMEFPGTKALDMVNFTLRKGEVHVLFGENGAGKSTLVSIIAGVYSATSGKILHQGDRVNFHSVHDAKELGIETVFQEFSLVPQLTVAQNLFLGCEETKRGILSKRKMRQEAKDMLKKLDFDISVDKKVDYLTRAEQQMVEITKVFNSKLSVLILDEPTASLTNKETTKLFNLIEKARNRGVGIIYISHRINEIKRIANRVTVLRDGKYVDTLDASKLDIDENHLVELMTGKVIDQVFPKIKFMPGEPILTVENLTTPNGMVNQVSFEICAGEIIGMAGLVSSGKSRALRACFGVEEIKEGKIIFNGEEIRKPNPKSMLKKGMFYVPSDRKMEGLLMNRSMKENISIASLPLPPFSRWKMILNKKGENCLVDSLVQKLNLKPFQVNHMVGHLSGGNQQKVLLARVLSRDIKLFVFDEPTVGVDIGTRVIIYDFIKELCEAGAAVVIISSDLSEILHLTNRTYVFYQGYKTAELKGDQIEEKNVLQNFFKRGAA